MKKIVVTGATGFIGREVFKILSENNDATCIGLFRNEISAPELLALGTWKCTDYSRDSLTFLMEGADAVIHLAGIKGNKINLSDYDEDYRMTENVLFAVKANKIGRMVYASSRLVYGNPDNIPWTEETEPEPVLAYGENKLRCEKLCIASAENNDHVSIIVRIAQVLGTGEGTRNMINVFQETARAGGVLKVMGKSIARRQYIYNKDLARILSDLVLRDEIETQIMNLGMREAYTNLEIAKAVNKAFRNKMPIDYDECEPETIQSSIMDVSRMTDVVGYMPMDMEQALVDIYEEGEMP